MILTVFAFAGCTGDPLTGPTGETGAQGPQGTQGTQGTQGPQGPAGEDANVTVNLATLNEEDLAALNMTGAITGVTIASAPVVSFTVTDEFGRGIVGLGLKPSTTLSYLRFALVKLVPGSSGSPDKWESYMVTNTARPTTENTGTITDNGDGTYSYTFAKDVTDVTKTGGVTYDATLTHRMAIQISASSNPFPPVNVTYDFVPAGGAVSTRHDMVVSASCVSCHGKFVFHGGSRQDVHYCVVCHTDQRRIGRTATTAAAGGVLTGDTYIVNNQALGNFVNLIHKIHMGNKLALTGYDYADVMFNEIGYPQSQANCRKCHQQTTDTPQGDNWKNKPSRLSCGGCHDAISFDSTVPTGMTGHTGGARADDSQCALCHDATYIEDKHTTDNETPNNPNVPAGAASFAYEISEVTVNASNQPVVKFRIMKDGAAATLICNASSSTTASTLLTGFSGSPGFIVAYAAAQDGITAPIDYNQKGKSAGQPASVTIANVCKGTDGTMSGPDASGYYTATLTVAAAAFPVGSTLRAVGLQGYFTQVSPAVARHAKSVIKAVTGDPVRRAVVDNDKCANCHEWLELHGGSRVDEIQICVVCHNPNLTSSGRGASAATVLARMSAADQAAMTEDGYNPADPSTFPEASNNFKNMIHGIHSSDKRSAPYQFVRDRGTSGVFYYDWSEVTFPGILSNCETCHINNTHEANLPEGVLVSTTVTTDGNAGTTVTADRASLPNSSDATISPITGACVSCHTTNAAMAHMEANGGVIGDIRSNTIATVEQCLICHGAGRTAGVSTVHKL
ncbi:MAG: OmcA/MtrC family decaheme c-type cytochrome [Nitrospirae bacterium]|nr:OmcA/MtrC family decaheme c-type cytochrome [Nitrospirota bacterium]